MKIVLPLFVNCSTPFCHITVFSPPWIGTPKRVVTDAFRARIRGGEDQKAPATWLGGNCNVMGYTRILIQAVECLC